MATGLVKGFWTFLNTDVRQLPWGELTKTGAEATKAALEVSKAFQEQAPQLQKLAPIAKDIEPFLKTLDSPIVQLAGAGLPFVSIAVTLAKVYLDHSKQEPTFGEIAHLSEVATRLPAEPSQASMALLLGEVLGDRLASQMLSEGAQVEVVLNPSTVAELEPYLSRKLLTLRSTGSVCSMGANNRVGNHVEELKRPYGLGSGFALSVTPQGRSSPK